MLYSNDENAFSILRSILDGDATKETRPGEYLTILFKLAGFQAEAVLDYCAESVIFLEIFLKILQYKDEDMHIKIKNILVEIKKQISSYQIQNKINLKALESQLQK